jgi:tol-pal system protein YbgF
LASGGDRSKAKENRMYISRLVFPPKISGITLGLLMILAAPGFGQRREDILSIQRDVAQLQDQVKQMQTAQDQKLAAIQALVQQAVEESAKLNAALNAFQKNVGDRLAEQQSKVVAPVVMLGAKVDEISDDLRSVRENVASLSTRLGTLDNKLADISAAVRTLATPPPPPPSSDTSPQAGIAVPPGVTADSLWTAAFRDYSSGKDELAMREFADYLKYFPQTENAPSAQYYMGQIYVRAKQYDDAVQAFDAVLERFPENPKSPDALYMKGVALMNTSRRAEAAVEFREFLDRYPGHNLTANAQAHLRTLGSTARPSSTRTKKK